MKTNIQLSGQAILGCINKDNTYNKSEIMRIANNRFKFYYLFNKSLTWSEVLTFVWKEVKRVMNQFRKPKTNKVTYISGGDFKSYYNAFGRKYKIVN